MVQLESPTSLEHVDAIAAVPGVDVLMFGPGDFSILAGIPGQFDHPLIHEAYRRVDAAAKRAGKWWATTSPSPEHSQMLLDLGANMVCHGGDLLHLRNGLLDMQRRFEPLGFKFDDRLNGPTVK
jgi:4-hydroxy-2-oxoheptanedioate aldolase